MGGRFRAGAATSVRQGRPNEVEQGPTEPCTGCGKFRASAGDEWGRHCCVAHCKRADSQRDPDLLPEASGISLWVSANAPTGGGHTLALSWISADICGPTPTRGPALDPRRSCAPCLSFLALSKAGGMRRVGRSCNRKNNWRTSRGGGGAQDAQARYVRIHVYTCMHVYRYTYTCICIRDIYATYSVYVQSVDTVHGL